MLLNYINIHNFQFCGALCAENFILQLCAGSAPENMTIFLLLPCVHGGPAAQNNFLWLNS